MGYVERESIVIAWWKKKFSFWWMFMCCTSLNSEQAKKMSVYLSVCLFGRLSERQAVFQICPDAE